MSVDLAVWDGPSPASSEEATATFERLYERYVGSDDQEPPTDRIAGYVAALLARFPDITDIGDDEEDTTPWADGPMIGNASGPFIYFGMVTNDAVEAGWTHAVTTAHSMGLVAFDPQSGRLADPDPSAAPEPQARNLSMRGTGVGARMYRWSSLRSYRWPILVPLAALLRRFR